MGKTQLCCLVPSTGLEVQGTGMQKELGCWYGVYAIKVMLLELLSLL
jgi:hypothetical protein